MSGHAFLAAKSVYTFSGLCLVDAEHVVDEADPGHVQSNTGGPRVFQGHDKGQATTFQRGMVDGVCR